MAQTLFERLVYGKTKPEQTIYNPLDAKVGNRFLIDTIEHRVHGPYILKGLSEYTRDKDRKFTDYLFDEFRLRIMPNHEDKIPFSCYLLKSDGREGWIPELNDCLRDPTGIFIVNRGNSRDEYFRFLSEGEVEAGSPHLVTVRELFDENGDGKIQENEISSTEIEYFDFYRELRDEAGQTYSELLFVDFNLDDKTFQFWVGTEIIPQRITCL